MWFICFKKFLLISCPLKIYVLIKFFIKMLHALKKVVPLQPKKELSKVT